MSKTKRWLFVLSWNAVFLLAALAAIELALRFSFFNDVRNPPAGNPPGYYVADSELGVRIAPNQPTAPFRFQGPTHDVFSNDLGCFDKRLTLAPDEPYVLAIGDSFTWGYNALADKWTSHLERRSGMRVVKCGVPGTGTRYQLTLLKKLLARLPHAPRTVIHLYDTTDFNDDFIFPGETVHAGQRVDDFDRIRLSDGHRVPRDPTRTKRNKVQLYGGEKQKPSENYVLLSLLRMALLVDKRVETRRLVLEGKKPAFLKSRYQFNLLLLDPKEYPFVAQQLGRHMDALREMRETVRSAGSNYVLFHTNSFRLPADRPLVARQDRFLRSIPEFGGRMPELDRHAFDPHWNADSEKQVATIMMKWLVSANALQDSTRFSHRELDNRIR